MKCRLCGEEKDASKFYTRGAQGKDDRCGECVAELMRLRRERLKAAETCSCCGGPKEERYVMCIACRLKERARRTGSKVADPETYRRKRREAHRRTKLKVLEAYGGCKCACCGETHMEFMTIDHINGGGEKHRKELIAQGRSGNPLYGWLIRNKFPAGFRVLCMNCNFAIGHFGVCPHELEKSAATQEAHA